MLFTTFSRAGNKKNGASVVVHAAAMAGVVGMRLKLASLSCMNAWGTLVRQTRL